MEEREGGKEREKGKEGVEEKRRGVRDDTHLRLSMG